ncbi:MAG: hypothetical protein WKG32_22385 [Gemmatimonadaceae bacterium]
MDEMSRTGEPPGDATRGDVIPDAIRESVAELPPSGADDATVFDVLAGQARAAPSGRLWAATAVGTFDAVVLGVAHPGLWWVAAASVCLAAYGGWGLADRALARDGEHEMRGSLRLARGAAAVVGVISAIGTVLGLMGAALGGWIL